MREKKRALTVELEKIEEEIRALEAVVIERLDQEGVEKATGRTASVSVSENIVANITDFDALCAFVKKTGYFHLFQRRVTDTACRELWEQKKAIPGLEPFTKRRLNIRTLS
jgi:hypothetical protein